MTTTLDEDTSHCPVCMDWYRGEIYQCKEGHLVCGSCKSDLSACPTCRAPMQSIRARAVESILKSVVMPCRWQDAGCTKLGPRVERDAHEQACAFRLYSCPFKCDHTCGVYSMAQHILDKHYPERSGLDIMEKGITKIHRFTSLSGPLHQCSDTTKTIWNWPIKCSANIFHVHIAAANRHLHVRIFSLFNPSGHRAMQFTFPLGDGFEHSIMVPIEAHPGLGPEDDFRELEIDETLAAAKLHLSTFTSFQFLDNFDPPKCRYKYYVHLPGAVNKILMEREH